MLSRGRKFPPCRKVVQIQLCLLAADNPASLPSITYKTKDFLLEGYRQMGVKASHLPPKPEVTYTFVRLFAISCVPTMKTLAADHQDFTVLPIRQVSTKATGCVYECGPFS